MRKPYQQGDLDGLCGVYALVNAVDYLCGPLSKKSARRLFHQILTHLEDKGPLASRCIEGIMINDIASILKTVICPHYPIRRYKPFHRYPRVNQHHYLKTLREFLAQPNTIVLIAIECQYNHWTLVHHMTDKTMQTWDSSDLHYLLLSHCSMIDDALEKRHWLMPVFTYFLKATDYKH